MSHSMVVGDVSLSWVKVTVPLTLESPRRTATVVVVQWSARKVTAMHPQCHPRAIAISGQVITSTAARDLDERAGIK